ncbi:nuclear transport factor 2 family protein [Glaciihabitans sp. dw_435]|uniref:nuclear transport factor 2 family protein n=1 Tax=Glaciihabitans sp. dw_435 TaxID=2720081 RepID=UPI001BD25E41|nr:nuclear transport factor 2 family protein [Glaciihabitans sp. dw_435]
MTAASSPDHAAVLAVIHGMYANYMTGNRVGIDEVLADGFTMYDSAHTPLITGFDELNDVRAGRPSADGPPSEVLTEYDVHVSVDDDLAIAAYMLRVDFPDRPGAAPEICRVTAVMRRVDASWRIIHLHEDVLPAEVLAS